MSQRIHVHHCTYCGRAWACPYRICRYETDTICVAYADKIMAEVQVGAAEGMAASDDELPF